MEQTKKLYNAEDITYDQDFIKALEYISTKEIKTIYFGHGPPLDHDCIKTISNTLKHIRKA